MLPRRRRRTAWKPTGARRDGPGARYPRGRAELADTAQEVGHVGVRVEAEDHGPGVERDRGGVRRVRVTHTSGGAH